MGYVLALIIWLAVMAYFRTSLLRMLIRMLPPRARHRTAVGAAANLAQGLTDHAAVLSMLAAAGAEDRGSWQHELRRPLVHQSPEATTPWEAAQRDFHSAHTRACELFDAHARAEVDRRGVPVLPKPHAIRQSRLTRVQTAEFAAAARTARQCAQAFAAMPAVRGTRRAGGQAPLVTPVVPAAAAMTAPTVPVQPVRTVPSAAWAARPRR